MDIPLQIAACLLRLRALLHPQAEWAAELSPAQRAAVAGAARQLTGRLGAQLQEWAAEGAGDREQLQATEREVEQLLGALALSDLNHPAQRGLNLAAVLDRLGGSAPPPRP